MLFHLFVAAIISMSTVIRFLESDMGLRFYGFSKLGIWGFCVIQVCFRRRPGANADVMSCWKGKLHATSEDSACKRLL